MEVPKSLMTNKVKRTSKAKLVSVCQQNVSKAVTLNELKFSLRHIINILLTELSRSVWENLHLGLYSRPRSRFPHTAEFAEMANWFIAYEFEIGL